MLKRIKLKFKSADNRRLLSNFFSLTVLQGANYVFPLITLPYLVRVLGVEKYGLLAFASVTTAYFGILMDYGFGLTASREIAINQDNWDKITEIFSAVMSIKLLLMFVSIVLLGVLVFSFDKFSGDWKIYYLTFGVVAVQTFFPIWFFQGMEEMKYITYFNLAARLIFTIAIFIFIRSQEDFYLVPVIRAVGAAVSVFMAVYLIHKRFEVIFRFQSAKTLLHYFKDAYHIFISNIAISLYTISTTFILGLFTNNTIVGYFAAADKIIQAVKGLTGPVSQAIYPYISKRVSDSERLGLQFIRKIAKYMALATGGISLFIFVFAAPVVHLLLGNQYEDSIVVLRIMSLLPFLIGMSNIFGIQTMMTFGRKQAFSRIIMTGSVLNLILSFVLVPIFYQVGSAISVVVVESFITVAMFVYLQKNGLKIVGENCIV